MFWPWTHSFLLTVGHFPCLFAHGPFFVAWHALLLFSSCVLDIFDFLYLFLSCVWGTVKLLRNSLTFQVMPLNFLRGNRGCVYLRLIIPYSEAKLSLIPHGLWGVQSGWCGKRQYSSPACMLGILPSDPVRTFFLGTGNSLCACADQHSAAYCAVF